MGRINLGAGSSGPRCSVFSRLAGFGLQMWAWVGVGPGSRCVRPEQKCLRGGTWAQEAGAPEAGPRRLSTHARSSTPPPAHGPQGQKGFGVQKNSDSGAGESEGLHFIA